HTGPWRMNAMAHAEETRTGLLLVAYDGSPMSEAQLHLACRAANEAASAVRVLHVVERPWQIPVGQLLPHEQASVDELRRRASAVAARYNVPWELVVEHAHDAGEAIVAEAIETRAQQIFVGLQDRRRPGTSLLLSRTLRHVLRYAP